MIANIRRPGGSLAHSRSTTTVAVTTRAHADERATANRRTRVTAKPRTSVAARTPSTSAATTGSCGRYAFTASPPRPMEVKHRRPGVDSGEIEEQADQRHFCKAD